MTDESGRTGTAPSSHGPSIDEAPGKSRRRIFFVCSVALFMGSMDLAVVATALPKIGASLHAPVNWLGWTITVYGLGLIVAYSLAGRVSDQIGRKTLFLICVIVFTLASVACGLSTSIYMLVPLRFLQAIGAAGFLPSASGIVADAFGRDRDRAIGFFASIAPIGGVFGPSLGGIITQYWSWRGIFLVNVPIGVLLAVMIVRVIPRTEPKAFGAIDVSGMVLLTVMLSSGMVAITFLGDSGASSLGALGGGAIAIGSGIRFFRHVRRAPNPIIPPELITGRGFGVMNFVILAAGVRLGAALLIPLYAVERYGMSLARAGTTVSLTAFGSALVAFFASVYLRRTGYRVPLVSGLVIMSLAFWFLSVGARGISPYWWLALGMLGLGVGSGVFQPAANNAMLQRAPDRIGAVTGLRSTVLQSGSILWVALQTAALARGRHAALVHAHLLWVTALVLAAAAAACMRMEDHRGSW